MNTSMNFALFEAAVVKGLQEKMGEDYRILPNQVKKNNGIVLTGIIVEEKNSILRRQFIWTISMKIIRTESALIKLWSLCTGFFIRPESGNPWICRISWNMKRQRDRLPLKL